MKALTINVQIQFDQHNEKDVVDYSVDTIQHINKVLQREFPDISPVIFTGGIDKADIEVQGIGAE